MNPTRFALAALGFTCVAAAAGGGYLATRQNAAVQPAAAATLATMAAGADDFISKPYDPDELKSRLIVAERIIGVQDRVKRLEGILPTCMYCKKIRDEQNEWVGIEAYITKRSEASFSHGVCPSCYESVLKQELSSLKRGTKSPSASTS